MPLRQMHSTLEIISRKKLMSEKENSYPVNLLDTAFPMRGDLAKREPQWVSQWQKNKLRLICMCCANLFVKLIFLPLSNPLRFTLGKVSSHRKRCV